MTVKRLMAEGGPVAHMSVRDWLAGQALNALAVHSLRPLVGESRGFTESTHAEEAGALAQVSRVMADALLAELRKEPSE